MPDQRITDPGYDQEEAYFHQHDVELIAKRRLELDRQRAAMNASTPSNAMRCPRCGAILREIALHQVKVDRCDDGCGGVFLDQGELELLTRARSPGLLKKLLGGLHRA